MPLLCLKAQNGILPISADEALTYLDKTSITTGILYDRVPHIAMLTAFNKNGRIDTSSTEHLLQAYYEV